MTTQNDSWHLSRSFPLGLIFGLIVQGVDGAVGPAGADGVHAHRNAITTLKNAEVIQRNAPFIAALQAHIGLTEAQVDALFGV